MAKYTRNASNKVNLNKVIFRFVSSKGNEVFKLSSTVADGVTGEIVDGSALITKEQANTFNTKYGWEIIDIAKNEDGEWKRLEDELYEDEDESVEEDIQE